ncbi:MAG TPA: ABC transporter ATP-binding protein, partial [Ardenticatenaceae bacterium]|nr:ABC transporter ATP-binding protein [Ardenticatenaceae bacterium]
MAEATDLVIRADGVGKRFDDVWAVRDLTFSVARGWVFCLLGPSGSGKTTALRMMLGVFTPDAGSLTVLGLRPVEVSRELHQRIGYMPQLFVLYPTLTIEENLNFVGLLYQLGWHRRRRRIREVLVLVELWPHRRKSAGQISGGMQRRVALAAALLHEPELLFVDEPTAGIDPILRATLWEEFRRLNA